jgi:uncharacterized SAM-binding protein YcdF (DUF218 family)
MFDSPQCLRPFNGVPLSFDWGVWNGLKLPLILALAVGLLLGLGWLLRRLGKPRRLVVYGLGAFLTIALLSADLGLTLFLPADPGTPVDAIVILGRGTDWRPARVELSAELWRTKRAPLIFVSGINDTPKMLEMLSSMNIPPIALDGENCSLTTAENALFTAAILKARGMEKIILITDRAHLWRSYLDFQTQGLEQIIPIASGFPPGMGWADQRILVAREYFFLFTSSLYQLVSGQRVSAWNSPDSAKLVELAQAYGKSKAAPAPSPANSDRPVAP